MVDGFRELLAQRGDAEKPGKSVVALACVPGSIHIRLGGGHG